MDNLPSNNTELVVFFEELITEIKNKTLDVENYKLILDFFLQYKFHNCTEGKKEEEWVRDMTMGWYIYNFCIKNNIESNK